MELGRLIKEARKAKGMTQQELNAEKISRFSCENHY